MNSKEPGEKLFSDSKIKEINKSKILEESKVLKEEASKIYSFTPKINKM